MAYTRGIAPIPFLPLLLAALLVATTCASSSTNQRKYPPRRPGCALKVYHSALPEVTTWEDLGIAEVGCYIDESDVACLHRLRVEACRMGGDIVYNVPKRALRPTERGMMYRGRVAHTTEPPPRKTADPPEMAPPADADPKAPITPLPPAPEQPPTPTDGGTG